MQPDSTAVCKHFLLNLSFRWINFKCEVEREKTIGETDNELLLSVCSQ